MFDNLFICFIVLSSILEDFLMHRDERRVIEVEVILLEFGLDSIEDIAVLDKGEILFE